MTDVQIISVIVIPITFAFRLLYRRLLSLSRLLLFVGDHKGDIGNCGSLMVIILLLFVKLVKKYLAVVVTVLVRVIKFLIAVIM